MEIDLRKDLNDHLGGAARGLTLAIRLVRTATIPLFPALRYGPTAVSGASPAKCAFLAATHPNSKHDTRPDRMVKMAHRHVQRSERISTSLSGGVGFSEIVSGGWPHVGSNPRGRDPTGLFSR